MNYKVRISTLKSFGACQAAISLIERSSGSYQGDCMIPPAADKIDRIKWRSQKLVLEDHKTMTDDQFFASYGVVVTDLISNEELLEQV